LRSVVLDTNLLVLLVVGNLEPALIPRHKRTRKFSVDDHRSLRLFLARFPKVIITPNVATETVNLLQQTDEPTARRLLGLFSVMVPNIEEQYLPTETAVLAREFPRLGLTDVVALVEVPADSVLLTDDLDLYLAAQKRGRTAYNFGHLQSYDPP
jgi:hypothetical protein